MNQSEPDITLPESDAPLHERLAQAIAALIDSGQYGPGQRLPTHRALARRAGVAIGTVTRAIEHLHQQGLVRGEVGRGTFVSARPAPQHARPVDLTLSVPPVLIDERLFIAAAERAARKALDIPDGGLRDLKGTQGQRSIVAGWLSRTRVGTTPESVILCVGAQQAIHLSFADVARRSRLIAGELPTFSGALASAAHLGLEWLPIAYDEEGMTPDALARGLRETGCRAIYTVPVCQNPLGFEVGEQRRREILKVARQYDAVIIEDDIYSVHSAKGGPTYRELDPERVYYLTSLSKCLTPLARLGVLLPPASRLSGIARSLRAEAFGAPPISLEFGCALIEMGADTLSADALRKEAALRTDMAARILKPPALPMPEGAPHIWLPSHGHTLPRHSAAFAQADGLPALPKLRFYAFALGESPACTALIEAARDAARDRFAGYWRRG